DTQADEDDPPDADRYELLSSAGVTVPAALSRTSRLFIRGEAGSGKTTLLKWIAVRSALGELPSSLEAWNSSVPFFISLRRYVDRELPSLEQFPESIGRFIADEMPKGFVLGHLRAGRATVLVDGVDEFPESRRADARRWVDELIAAFPDARYVITSRPGAVPPGWLASEG